MTFLSITQGTPFVNTTGVCSENAFGEGEAPAEPNISANREMGKSAERQLGRSEE